MGPGHTTRIVLAFGLLAIQCAVGTDQLCSGCGSATVELPHTGQLLGVGWDYRKDASKFRFCTKPACEKMSLIAIKGDCPPCVGVTQCLVQPEHNPVYCWNHTLSTCTKCKTKRIGAGWPPLSPQSEKRELLRFRSSY